MNGYKIMWLNMSCWSFWNLQQKWYFYWLLCCSTVLWHQPIPRGSRWLSCCCARVPTLMIRTRSKSIYWIFCIKLIKSGVRAQIKAFPLPLLSLSFMTPLHVAAERAHNDILEVLQKHGAKVCCYLPCVSDITGVLMLVCLAAGECCGHPWPDSPPQSSSGWAHPDMQVAAKLRGWSCHRVPAGFHCCSDGQWSCAANSEW